MKTYPGHTGRPRNRVCVIRLMHVPEKTDSGSLHGQMLLRLWREAEKVRQRLEPVLWFFWFVPGDWLKKTNSLNRIDQLDRTSRRRPF